MQKLSLKQALQQKLSPQQIQFIKLLQVPTAELEARIKEELEENPVLEEGKEEPEYEDDFNNQEEETPNERDDDINLDDYLQYDELASYKTQAHNSSRDDEDREIPIATGASMTDNLMMQLGYLRLNEREEVIARQLIGSIESDGYIRRDLEAIVNDLAFTQNVETDHEEVESVLFKIQEFDPAGIGARNLQECLSLQLDRKEQDDDEGAVYNARRIVTSAFEEFIKKHYEKIRKRLNLSDDELKAAIAVITRLNPKPGGTMATGTKTEYIIPDFIITSNNGKLEVALNARNAPDLKVSRSYSELLQTYDKSNKKDKKLKETVSFVKQKLDAAKWFIDAIRQRQETLMRTMTAIISLQEAYFLSGDESKIRPMILKDIAEKIDMDISTVSRVANSKYVQTDFGVFPLKHFFSEGIATESGDDVSSKEVKHVLKQLIGAEDKRKPLSDEKLEKLLKEKGYNIARRTVAKYREQIKIPVARLRKEL